MKVIFEPDGKTVDVPRGWSVLKAATTAELKLNSSCGGEGICGTCRILIPENPPPPTPADRKLIPSEDLKRGFRLACQTRIETPITIFIPYETASLSKKSFPKPKSVPLS